MHNINKWILSVIMILMVSVLNLSAATTVALDTQNATNGDCPGEHLQPPDGHNVHFIKTGTGTMHDGWDIDRFYFKPAYDGTLTIKLSAPKALTIKAGNACNTQTFFRSNNAKNHSNTFHISANDTLFMSIFDWESGNGYQYNLSVEFVPDHPDATDSDTTNVVIDTNDYNARAFSNNGKAGNVQISTAANELVGSTQGTFSVDQGGCKI